MRVPDHFLLAFHNLMLHKVRSILTSLGIIFGVGSVISMLSISEGAKEQAIAQISAMGIDKIIVFSKKPPAEGKDTTNTTNSSIVETYGLTEQDLDHIRHMDNVSGVSTARNTRKKILRGTTRTDLLLVGVSPDFLRESRSEVIQGRWLSRIDYSSDSNVCVIGRNAKRKLFTIGERNIIGSNLKIDDSLFRIVGIIENNLGTQISGIGSPNDLVLIPMSTSDALYGKKAFTREPHSIMVECVDFDTFIVTVTDIAYIDYTSKRIAAYLEKSHADKRDWEHIVPFELLKQREQTQNIFTVVMSSIAGISLLVGGIGIMNIMLANVYERRKEIGTRRALGAKKSDIIIQFLLETIFLTSIGGAIGVVLGVLISDVVTRYAGWPVIFSIWSVLLSLVISAFIGIVFGTYPAWKAAQQNPIDVLRAE